MAEFDGYPDTTQSINIEYSIILNQAAVLDYLFVPLNHDGTVADCSSITSPQMTLFVPTLLNAYATYQTAIGTYSGGGTGFILGAEPTLWETVFAALNPLVALTLPFTISGILSGPSRSIIVATGNVTFNLIP